MNCYEAATSRRTIRKFSQKPIEREMLERYINAARLAPSAANMQPLKYCIVDAPAPLSAVFDAVKWAAYIAPKGNPAENERPTAFIMVLADTTIKSSGYELDAGAAIQNILLSAWEDGIGSCWMGAIDRDAIRKILSIPEQLLIVSAIALGYKAEDSRIEPLESSVKYWKDADGMYHVPKRSVQDILI